jgi:hypothetical protein
VETIDRESEVDVIGSEVPELVFNAVEGAALGVEGSDPFKKLLSRPKPFWRLPRGSAA